MNITMDIKGAKNLIKDTIEIYRAKDEYGNYILPVNLQRPIMIIGAPGIGKTEIMFQVGRELNLPVVSYSMTHHTRQSALGLPQIVTKTYGDKSFVVSEYTMSEIIADIYEKIDITGSEEGILFLDEINCVSETLAPSMLQFLQYKTFGGHKVPDGWVIVTAGNPPEYNKSVKEFDVVTWDRLKRIDVKEDYNVWKEYAYTSGIHQAIISYLDLKGDDFYRVENVAGEKVFVTARGWADLSKIIQMYEDKQKDPKRLAGHFEVNEKLISQYVQYPRIAKDFHAYYDIYNKYKSDYQIEDVLRGRYDDEILEKAKTAEFDERLALIGLMIDGTVSWAREVYEEDEFLRALGSELKVIMANIKAGETDYAMLFKQAAAKIENEINRGREADTMKSEDIYKRNRVKDALDNILHTIELKGVSNAVEAYKVAVNEYNAMAQKNEEKVKETQNRFENAFDFCDKAYPKKEDGVVILLREFSLNFYSVRFISNHGVDAYFKYNDLLLVSNIDKNLMDEINKADLGLDELDD